MLVVLSAPPPHGALARGDWRPCGCGLREESGCVSFSRYIVSVLECIISVYFSLGASLMKLVRQML